jgi:RNA polymerase sigma-70 factor (ECF subfamily)
MIGLRRRQDPDLFMRLVTPHMQALHRLAFRFTTQASTAEDLVQELLTRLYARAERLDKIENLRPWLARALYNLFIDERRRWIRNPLRNTLEPTDEDISDGTPRRATTPEFHAEMNILTQTLQELLDKLPDDQRAVVLLRDVEGYELHETASILGIPLGTAKSRLHRAHLQLQNALQQRNLRVSNFVSMDEAAGVDTSTSDYGVASNDV